MIKRYKIVAFFRHDKLIIDDHVYIYNDQEHRIERLPVTVTPGIDEELGEASSLSRRLRQKQSQNPGSFNANAKRAQSVESMLDRIPSVVGTSPNDHMGKFYTMQTQF